MSGSGAGLRVLVAHNRYRSDVPSGENQVVDAQCAGLEARGVAVDRLIAESDDIDRLGLLGKAALPLDPTWSASGRRRYRELVAAHRPDVLHLHNPFPLISPSIVRWAHADGIPVVQTVHNHRHVCIAGTFLRDGQECRDCEGRRVPTPGVVHGCYRGSRAQSFAQAAAVVAHRGTWAKVARFLAVSGATAATLRSAGIAAERIEVCPNGIPDPGEPTPVPRDGGVLYAGRLTAEKGVDLLLDLWSGPDAPDVVLRLAGGGALLDHARHVAASHPNVEVLGLVPSEQVHAELRRAAVVVVPSRWPDPLPTIAIEALAHGRPVVATRVGGLPEIVDDPSGVLVGSTTSDLTAGLQEVLANAAALGAGARRRYEAKFTEEAALDRLLATYEAVITAR